MATGGVVWYLLPSFRRLCQFQSNQTSRPPEIPPPWHLPGWDSELSGPYPLLMWVLMIPKMASTGPRWPHNLIKRCPTQHLHETKVGRLVQFFAIIGLAFSLCPFPLLTQHLSLRKNGPFPASIQGQANHVTLSPTMFY